METNEQKVNKNYNNVRRVNALNKNTFSSIMLSVLIMLAGGAYSLFEFWGTIYYRIFTIPLFILALVLTAYIGAYRYKLNSIIPKYYFDYAEDVRQKNSNWQCIIYYLENFIEMNRIDDAKRMLQEYGDLISPNEFELFRNILNEEYEKCISFINSLELDDEKVKQRIGYWKEYCAIKLQNQDIEKCNALIKQLQNESKYIQSSKSEEKKNKQKNLTRFRIGKVLLLLTLVGIALGAIISPSGKDRDKVFTSAFRTNRAKVIKVYEEENGDKAYGIYVLDQYAYFVFFEKNHDRYKIKGFKKNSLFFLEDQDFFEFYTEQLEGKAERIHYNSDKTVYAMVAKIDKDKTDDGRRIELIKEYAESDVRLYIYAVYK